MAVKTGITGKTVFSLSLHEHHRSKNPVVLRPIPFVGRGRFGSLDGHDLDARFRAGTDGVDA